MAYAALNCLLITLCYVSQISGEGESTEPGENDMNNTTLSFDTSTVNPYTLHHPHDIQLIESNYKFLNISWSAPVSYNISTISYIVYYSTGKQTECPLPEESARMKNVSGLLTSTVIKGLNHGSYYSVCIASYSPNGLETWSALSIFTTEGFGGDARECSCQTANVDPSGPACNYISGECHCIKAARGYDCSECVAGYYRYKQYSCMPCNCDTKLSNGSCYVNTHGLEGQKMCYCHDNYSGPRCGSCVNGYYMNRQTCQPCHCWLNSRPNSNNICNPLTGECKDCWYNTTGTECELCLPRFTGFAHNKTCLPEAAHHNVHNKLHHLGVGLVIFICCVIVIALCVAAAAFIYWSVNAKRRPYSLWSVKIDRNRDDVNFSRMIDNEWDESDPVMSSSSTHVLTSHASSVGKARPSDQRLQLKVDGADQMYSAINT